MIDIRDLAVSLGGRRVLDGIDLHVARGEAVALVGPNGAGKTTILKSIAGLVRYSGRITVGGKDALRDPTGSKRLMGYMPQVPAFCEETVRSALAFVAALRGVPGDEIRERLLEVGLLGEAKRRVKALSTGMKQRLSLAAALLGDPPVLLLDEPTASLDFRGQRELVELLRRLQRSGRTILLSSHRSEEILALAHRVVVIDLGRIAGQGPVDVMAETFPDRASGIVREPAFLGAVR